MKTTGSLWAAFRRSHCLDIRDCVWTDSAHWFLRYTGADAESGTWYGFWSGFGGQFLTSHPGTSSPSTATTIATSKDVYDWGSQSKAPVFACPAHHPPMKATSVHVRGGHQLAHKAHLEREAS